MTTFFITTTITFLITTIISMYQHSRDEKISYAYIRNIERKLDHSDNKLLKEIELRREITKHCNNTINDLFNKNQKLQSQLKDLDL